MDIGLIASLVVVLVSVLISITLHEAVHAFTAHWLGDDTAYQAGRLTLNPIAHIDPFMTVGLPLLLTVMGLPPFGAAKPVPFNPYRLKYDEYGSALVGAAGPLSNLVLAGLSGMWVRFAFPNSGLITESLLLFMFVNIGFFVFNMIPFPPLDGSRVLFAFAPDPLRDIMRTIERGGLMAIFIFFFLVFPLIQPVVINTVNIISGWILGVDLNVY